MHWLNGSVFAPIIQCDVMNRVVVYILFFIKKFYIMSSAILPRKLLKRTLDGLNAVSTSHVFAATQQIDES